MGIGSSNVANYANVTEGIAVDVIADGSMGGSGVIVSYISIALLTEDGSFLITESGNNIIL